MSFIEVRFPELIAYRSLGGPVFRTGIIETASGREYRNQGWAQSLRRYDLAHPAKVGDEIEQYVDFFETMGGREHMFRFKDWRDYLLTVANGILGTGEGNGGPTYQIRKRRTFGSTSRDKDIRKPVAGSIEAFRDAVALVYGASAGNISIDTTTGIITFVPDVSLAITGHTVGASHVFTTGADITGLIVGSKVYLSGVTGTAATTLNGVVHSITGKSGSGPYTWTISTTTTGLTASGGLAEKYPQPGEALTCSGEYDIPVRFDTDELMITIEAPGIYLLDSLPLVERRV